MLKWKPYGPDALLFEFAERADEPAFVRSRALVRELETRPPPGLVEFVPAFTTLLLIFEPGSHADLRTLGPDLAARLGALEPLGLTPPVVKSIPVVYDGADLARVAGAHDLTVPEVVVRHTAPLYRVHMLGFAPGFAYLGGLDPRLHTPRLASPRPRVPAGSVAIGGEHTGIYPVASPGGWNLIGRTTVALFEPGRPEADGGEAMFLLRPGDQVKFVAVEP